MDALKALGETVQLANERGMGTVFYEQPHVDYDHLCDMLDRAATGKFTEAKLNRWLGYAQGVLVAHGIATLEEMKEINRRNGGDV